MRISDWSSDVCSSDLAHECVYRQQLDGGDAETLQIFNVLGMAECAESTAIMRWKTVASPGQSLQMRFVDHRLAARMMRRPIADPVEVIVDHHRSGHVCRTVTTIE